MRDEFDPRPETMSAPERIAVLQAALQERGLAGVILFYSRDVFYYTGTAQPAWLVVRPDDYALFVHKGIDFARRESILPSEHVREARSLDAVCEVMFPGPGLGEPVGSELDLLSVRQAEAYRQALGARRLVDCSSMVLEQRMIKSADELGLIAEACAALHAGHLAALKTIAPGITELELAAAVENAHRLAGHDGLIFMRRIDFCMSRGPLASGPNLREISGLVFSITGRGLGPAVAAGPSRRTIEDGDFVLVDIPTCVSGYHADQARMYCLGDPPDGAASLFERLKAVADRLIDSLRPGMTSGQAFDLAWAEAEARGLGTSFLRFPSGVRAHFIGHGVGLEMNEPPILARDGRETLEAGMVLALEMHVMEPEGWTLKLEDTVLLTETGCRVLNLSPRTLSVP